MSRVPNRHDMQNAGFTDGRLTKGITGKYVLNYFPPKQVHINMIVFDLYAQNVAHLYKTHA